MVVCVFFFSTDNDLLINRWVTVETADADGTWEGWFVGTIINYNKQSKQYTISFDDFDSTHNIVVPGDEIPKMKFVFLSEPVNHFIEFLFFQANAYSMPWQQKLSGLLPWVWHSFQT